VTFGEPATVRSWFDQHAGLASWISMLVAIAVAFVVVVADRLSTQRDKSAIVNAEINQISQAASEFDPIVRQYIKLVQARDPQANGYYDKQLANPRLSRMNVFIKMPVDLWPSVESYDAFRRYYDASFRLLETSAAGSPSINTEDRINASRGTLEALQKALSAARR
jgi:hypothetical protein